MPPREAAFEDPKYPEEMTWWTPILAKIMRRENLSWDEGREAAQRIFSLLEEGRAEIPLLMASFFGGLTAKKATVDELASMASAMDLDRERVRMVRYGHSRRFSGKGT